MSDSISFDGDTPRNQRFDDTYFSKNDGRAETRHVFLGANDLPTRWMQDQGNFRIAELGFGTGLNFFETVDSWANSNATKGLEYISFEAFPMSASDLQKSLEPWPEFTDGAKWITQHWPPEQGWHELTWRNAKLHLGIGDARDLIHGIAAPIDAWYLDGFAPARNPELWEEPLLQKVYDLTANEGSFATYTSAGWVRRSLQNAGFEVEKFAGFGTKREMMRGRKP